MNEAEEAAQVARWEAEENGHEITNPILKALGLIVLLGGSACALLGLVSAAVTP